jgi:hypothetical protein
MRTAIALVITAVVPAGALAEPPTKLFYVGEAKISWVPSLRSVRLRGNS